MGARVGTIYGDASTTAFKLAVTGTLKRLDYVQVEMDGRHILGQVQQLTRRSDFTYDDAISGDGAGDERLSADVLALGFVDERGRVQVPRIPFAPGSPVEAADDEVVSRVLGLTGQGAFLGHIKGGRLPVRIDMNTLAQKHAAVLAKTGAGKSYTVGVLLEELLVAGLPLVILDPHGEYGSLRSPNLDDGDLDLMARSGIKPRSFQSQIKEYALDTSVNPDAQRLRLEAMNLTGPQIASLLPAKLSGSQLGILYQAVKDASEALPAYTLEDINTYVQQHKSQGKWNVMAALDALIATRMFDVKGTPVADLVKPGQATIVNLRGVAPDIQEIAVTRITQALWEQRKRGDISPHIVVVEEAHNFCPERGVGNASSTAIIRTVASEGRKFGMGLVIVSQRPAKIDKNVLSQCNTQIILKVTNPNDLKAIAASIEGITADGADEIQRLPIGVALVAGGGLTRPVYVDVRPRMTRHGGTAVEMVTKPSRASKASGRSRAQPDTPVEAPSVRPATKVSARHEDVAPSRREEPPALAQSQEAVSWPSRAEAPSTPSTPDKEPKPRRPSADELLEADAAPKQPAPAFTPHAQPVETAPTPAPRGANGYRERNKHERIAIQRVAKRLGVVTTDDPDQALHFLRRVYPDDEDVVRYLDQLAAIGRSICLDPPRCISCPLADRCQHHAMLQAQRAPKRRVTGGLRRLWRP